MNGAPPAAATPGVPGPASQEEVVRFLLRPGSYPEPAPVEMIETHSSLVFLVGDRVYKMKKSMSSSFIDYIALEARRRNSEREVELDRQVAPGVYLGAVPVVRREDGTLAIDGEGSPVEWLVVMKRLDNARLMSNRLPGGVSVAEIGAVVELLADFYARAPKVKLTAGELLSWWREAITRVEAPLRNAEQLTRDEVEPVLTRLERKFEVAQEAIAVRAQEGRIVDGHGDLRPEHVYLGPPMLLLDRLEFDDRLRWVDPFDEAVFLGLECARLGAPAVEGQLIGGLTRRLGDAPPPGLVDFYRCYRACLRASLSIEHLKDKRPRTPERWPRQAREYLRLALLPDSDIR
jgi:aminoglycoside phosphotransferase family enzyme